MTNVHNKASSKRVNTLATFQTQHDTLVMWGRGGAGVVHVYVCICKTAR